MPSPTNVLPSDKPSIYASLSSLQQMALVTPNNTNPQGIAGFLIPIPTEEVAELNSDITDSYVENNTAIQDQIALRPERITLRGLVAELTANTLGAPPPLQALIDALPLNLPLVPVLTAGGLQIYNALSAADTATTAAIQATSQSLYQYYMNITGQNQPPENPLLALGTGLLNASGSIIGTSAAKILN